jgi:mRNA interferase MazF
MEKFVKGDIVVIPFPFSDLSDSKKRPALVLADLHGDDIILCQITSQFTKDNYSIPLKDHDFLSGKLDVPSIVRPNRIFTADKNIIIKKVALINKTTFDSVVQKIMSMLSS